MHTIARLVGVTLVLPLGRFLFLTNKNHFMKDQFVTYEIAKRMKELGFNEPCFRFWINDLDTSANCHKEKKNSELPDSRIAAPLWQQAIDWLRETHKIYVNFSTTIGECELQVSVTDNNTKRQSYADTFRLYQWYNPLEAKEHAILKALELLPSNDPTDSAKEY